ncbi:MAG TPA: ASKHA domain-containing protein, partial [Bryobacteraceae bacterium]|nr:ASKHA domain-containing protein [Bryobacteraceae bacterium]
AQAKGANAAGLQVVLSNYGASFEDIEVFYLAGGFGRHMNVDAAMRIGLLPRIPRERIVQAGNAAIEGASMALLSAARRAEMESLVRRVEHCRLETHPQFFDFFVDGCLFQPIGSAAGATP